MRRLYLILITTFAAVATADAQEFSAATNLVDYVCLGTLNAEVSAATGRHISLHAAARINPWTYHKGDPDKQMQNRHQTYALGMRYWPWYIYSGWWISGSVQYQEYNRGGIISLKTEEGDAYGISTGAGYSLMLHEHLNLDFGISFWAGQTTYMTYACPACGRIIDKGSKWFIMPDQLRVALQFIF